MCIEFSEKHASGHISDGDAYLETDARAFAYVLFADYSSLYMADGEF